MEENKKHKISKALIITIIILLILLLAGYLIYKNRDAFGVKTSGTIAKIFSPLTSSTNSKDLNKITAEAGEDIKKGDSVSVFGTGSNNRPIVVKTTNGGTVYGYANQDINNGNTGEITLNTGGSNTFWDSFSGFLGDIFNGNNNDTLPNNSQDSCTNGADNPPLCTTVGNLCLNGATNPPDCTNDGSKCLNGTDNFPLCTTINGQCINGSTNPPDCNSTDTNSCPNGADNPTLCTTIGGKCINDATNPPDCNTGGKPDLVVTGNVSPISATINTTTNLSAIVTNIGGGSTEHSFSSFFEVNTLNKSGVAVPVVVPTLLSGVGSTATATFKFTLLQNYSARLCADKKSFSDKGTIDESNENNNCGPYTIITVTNSIPTDGNICTNGADNPTLCTTKNGACIDGATNPPECTDLPTNPNEVLNKCLDIEKNPLTFTDAEKSQLTELLRKFYLIAPGLRTEDDINLTYSDITKYQNFSDHLTALTNQCYDQGIARDSYSSSGVRQSGSVNGNYKGPITRFGNPWYKYSTVRGSYINIANNITTIHSSPGSASYVVLKQCADGKDNDDDGKIDRDDPQCHKEGSLAKAYLSTNDSESVPAFNCRYISGWFSGRGADGTDCNLVNDQLYASIEESCSAPLFTGPTDNTSSSFIGPTDSTQRQIYITAKTNLCTWNEGVSVPDLEKILNVW